MTETHVVADELGKAMGFEVNFESRTGLDLDLLWGIKGKKRQNSSQAPCGTRTHFAGIEKATVDHWG